MTDWVQCLMPRSVETHVYVMCLLLCSYLLQSWPRKCLYLSVRPLPLIVLVTHVKIFIEPIKLLSVVERAWSWIPRLHHLSAKPPTTTDHWPLDSIVACHCRRLYWRTECKILIRSSFNTSVDGRVIQRVIFVESVQLRTLYLWGNMFRISTVIMNERFLAFYLNLPGKSQDIPSFQTLISNLRVRFNWTFTIYPFTRSFCRLSCWLHH